MSEEEDVNIDTLDDEEQEIQKSHVEDEDINTSIIVNETNEDLNPHSNENKDKVKHIRLPLFRIKSIMKNEPDCTTVISKDVQLLVTKATEMFIEFLSREAVKRTLNTKRKTMLKRDVDGAIEDVPHLCFLDGALDW